MIKKLKSIWLILTTGLEINDLKCDPESPVYMGHSEARKLGIAKCICYRSIHFEMPVFDCPFHGR